MTREVKEERKKNKMDSKENTRQFLSFFLTNELFAVEITQVKEIIEQSMITRVPMMPKYIEGVINLRGNVVPVVNLALRFGRLKSDKNKTTSIIVAEMQSDEGLINIGMIVDAVDEVVNIHINDIEKAPEFGTKIRVGFLSGIGKVNGKFIMIVNLETVLNIEELSSLEMIEEELHLQKKRFFHSKQNEKRVEKAG